MSILILVCFRILLTTCLDISRSKPLRMYHAGKTPISIAERKSQLAVLPKELIVLLIPAHASKPDTKITQSSPPHSFIDPTGNVTGLTYVNNDRGTLSCYSRSKWVARKREESERVIGAL
ncbi:hypothetical protein BD413DRAFT_254077 [Trametes elegans]|nr:hypothetical protein BD413DRAFT_254077 [Trametes elegans]